MSYIFHTISRIRIALNFKKQSNNPLGSEASTKSHYQFPWKNKNIKKALKTLQKKYFSFLQVCLLRDFEGLWNIWMCAWMCIHMCSITHTHISMWDVYQQLMYFSFKHEGSVYKKKFHINYVQVWRIEKRNYKESKEEQLRKK